jgi:hypothetical protein
VFFLILFDSKEAASSDTVFLITLAYHETMAPRVAQPLTQVLQLKAQVQDQEIIVEVEEPARIAGYEYGFTYRVFGAEEPVGSPLPVDTREPAALVISCLKQILEGDSAKQEELDLIC